jgi:hypothetical protein
MEKLVTLQGLFTTPTQLPGLTVCTCSEPAPAVVTKEYEWSLGGTNTYVTLTYTNPDGTTGIDL